MSTPAPTPLTRSVEAYLDLKRRILSLRMPPGLQFTENELVTEVGFSKTPVREALTRLRQEGLVVAIARSGYRVAPVTLKEARDLLATRTLLEGEAAASAAAASPDPDHLRQIERLCRASYDPQDRSSIVAFLEANTEFHVGVARLGNNSVLAEMLQSVLDRLERLFHLGLALSSRSVEIVHEHTDLVNAIIRGDVDGAREVAVDQSRESQAMVLNALLNSDAVLAATIDAPAELAAWHQ